MNIKWYKNKFWIQDVKIGFNIFFLLIFLNISFFNTKIFSFSLSTPVQISDAPRNSSAATVVCNSAGQAAATWITCDYDANFNVQAAVYTSGVWSAPVTLGSGDGPVVSINSGGNAVVVWMNPVYSGEEGVVPQIWGAMYNYTTGSWSSAVQISNALKKYTCSPVVINDDDGNSIATWVELCNCTDDCTCSLIAYSMYSNSTYSWSSPIYCTSCESHIKRAEEPSLHINGSGQVMMFWAENFSPSDLCSLVGRVYENSAWSDPSVITSNLWMEEIYNGGIDEAGKAMVVWQGKTDGNINVQAATYSQGTWSSPSVVIDEPLNFTFGYGLDQNGILVWNVITSAGSIVNAMTYSSGTWSPVTVISSQAGNGTSSRVAAGGTNNGAVMWGNGTDTGYVQFMSLSEGSWTQILSQPVHLYRPPVTYNLTVNSSSQIVAVWDDTIDGVGVIMATTGMI